tara:strand:+ start:18244 stop:19305 length:1062 start_codon:yes stop_codon:yes gene_type:complete
MDIVNLTKVMVPAFVAFTVGIAITPVITHFLYQYKVWKKNPGKTTLEGTDAIEFNKLHKENERKTPRMGGVVIWGSALITILSIWIISLLFPTAETLKMDFLSREQTWIPLFALGIGALTGFISDLFDVAFHGRGVSLRYRLLVVFVLSLFIGWWFYAKLAISTIGVPFGQPLEIGWLIIPAFILTSLGLYASGIIDGIDGLSGGVFSMIFGAYAFIALSQNQVDLAAFSAMLVGAILAFLWFNVPPARFYMTETGSMALTLTLATIAFMTDTLGDGIGIALLPIIGFLLVATVASTILQQLSKKFLKRKLFRIAPLHHHFEALGWPTSKVTFRYWILGAIFALFGIILALIA